MAGVIITSTTECVLCVNNDYAGINGALGTIQKKAHFQKDDIFRIALAPSDTWVEVQFKSREAAYFLFTFDGAAGTIKVDTIDGITPTSNSDLFDKLTALLG